MAEPGRAATGAGKLEGLLNLSFPPDPGREGNARASLERLLQAVPVGLNPQWEPGLLTLMPDSAPFSFSTETRPSETLLPLLRDLAGSLGPECRIDSTLRVQEFVDRTVREAVFVVEDDELTVAAREREARPEELPTLAEPTFADRAEGLLRRHRLAVTLLGAAVVLVAGFGWSQGWWHLGGGAATGPAIQAGPLEKVVEVESVSWSRKQLVFRVSPGEEFSRFGEVAGRCSLAPGLFRVLLQNGDELLPGIYVLDLRDLPARLKDRKDPLAVTVPCEISGFDSVLITR